ncbi:MAG TPA: pyridoxamine 5'-phosphate oxidase family protein [Acidimicrobiia bacterium]|jgi:hypothetical protein|nr:pyridoxamine 5'-phosphate oxidase family protein [Acidimicrobiia bacterium]
MAIHPVYRTSHGLTDEMREHLRRQGNVILATIGDDGAPHLTELLFLLDYEDRVQMPTPHNTRKFKNVQERPVATVFFYDQPGWTSATGTVELWEGERAAEANQRNRDRLLTEAGHATVGRVLADQEDATIVLTPTRWLSWSNDALIPTIVELGGDVEANPPDGWFRDLKADE